MKFNEWASFSDIKRYQINSDPMEAGYLELPPLNDQGDAEIGQAILWVKDSLKDENPQRFIYVWPEELEEAKL